MKSSNRICLSTPPLASTLWLSMLMEISSSLATSFLASRPLTARVSPNTALWAPSLPALCPRTIVALTQLSL